MPNGFGYVTKGVGGLYTVQLLLPSSPTVSAVAASSDPQPLDGTVVTARARNLRRREGLLVGDLVEVTYTEKSYTMQNGTPVPVPDGTEIAIVRVLPRRSALIRPPMANLDLLFLTVAAASPAPSLETLDKMICIAVHNAIKPIVVVNKCDLDPREADRICKIYRAVGLPVFRVTGITGEGVSALSDYISSVIPNQLAAFAGASGVGKSTLLGRIFPDLTFETGDVSHRIARGKNTTRHVEIHPLSSASDTGYLADTPGFTMLDFEQFDFFSLEDLPLTFPEFAPFLGTCRYTDCTHTKETDCAICAAVREGIIPRSRHETYVSLYSTLKKKPKWK